MSNKPPNVLLVICDQMRGTALGCAGVESVRTPRLDAFAGQGTRFTNAVSNTPACTPARATMLTGKHILSHGLVNNDMQLGHDHRSLARCLTDQGYACGYIGKWHLDGVNRAAFIPPGPRRQGFDDFWAGVECNHNYFAGYRYDETTRQPVWYDGYEPDGQTDLAIEYIRRRAGQAAPFLLALSFGPPHCPYQLVPEEFREAYPAEGIGFLPNAVDARTQDPATRGRLSAPADLPQEGHDEIKRRVIADYYAQVTALDACFGRLLDCLDDLGVEEDTIVIFTSDHGDMLFSQDRGWKSKPWRESVGIPLLIRWPGHVPAGRATNGPIGLVDLMPTLLRMTETPDSGRCGGAGSVRFRRWRRDCRPRLGVHQLPLHARLVPRSGMAWRGHPNPHLHRHQGRPVAAVRRCRRSVPTPKPGRRRREQGDAGGTGRDDPGLAGPDT